MADVWTTPPPYAGGCSCGAVRYIASAFPLGARICHCATCRRAMASPFLAHAQFPRSAVAITGQTASWRSSERLLRHFCPACGTRLFLESVDADRLGVPLGTLDDPEAIRPEMHIWVSQKLSWVQLDDRPHYPEGSPVPYRVG